MNWTPHVRYRTLPGSRIVSHHGPMLSQHWSVMRNNEWVQCCPSIGPSCETMSECNAAPALVRHAKQWVSAMLPQHWSVMRNNEWNWCHGLNNASRSPLWLCLWSDTGCWVSQKTSSWFCCDLICFGCIVRFFMDYCEIFIHTLRGSFSDIGKIVQNWKKLWNRVLKIIFHHVMHRVWSWKFST